MNRDILLKGSFFMTMLIVIVGIFLKFMHLDGAEPLLIICICTGLLFIVLAILEVNTSIYIDRSEKTMWTVGFIFMSGITGIVYLLYGRKRVMPRLG